MIDLNEEIQLAAGGLVFRQSKDSVELVIVHRPKYDDWSIPKGKQDPGETLEETALREVFEETRVKCRLLDPIGQSIYPGKIVYYWAMEPEISCSFVPNDEIDALAWVSLPALSKHLTHQQDRALVEIFKTWITKNRQEGF